MKTAIAAALLLCGPVCVQAQQREAYHELSHGAVAHHLGGIVNSIRLLSSGEIAGQTNIHDRSLLKRQRAMVRIAGYVGEVIFLGIDNQGYSRIDFEEAEKLYKGDLNDLVPEVQSILEQYQGKFSMLAGELQRNRSMTGQRFRQLLGALEPGSDHPSNRAEGKYLGKIAGQNVHIGGKPPWAGDGWNQWYTDWQDKGEGALCLSIAAVWACWGATMVFRGHRSMFDGALEHNVFLTCGVALLLWVGLSTYIMYGSGPSN